MFDTNKISEHMEVVGSDGQHVGTVDHVQGKLVKLTKADPAAHGEHHYIEISAVQAIKDQKLVLSVPAQQALAQGRDAGPRPELDR